MGTLLGAWDAYNNSPYIRDGLGTAGDSYFVLVGGTRNLGSGSMTFAFNDEIVLDGTLVWRIMPTSSSSGMVNPMTAVGDIIYSSSSTGTPARLPIGTAGQVLSVTAGIPSWTTASGTGTVTNVSSSNGALTVANPTTTPVLTVNSAPILTTARTINGVSFDGSANITVTAAAGTLTGTTLNSSVVTSSLTSVGTIATGVWNGTKISEAYGGTNQSTYTAGDILYASASNTLSKLGIGSNGQVLTLSAGLPSWATPTTGTVTSVTGTTNEITSTGGATPVIALASGGTLPGAWALGTPASVTLTNGTGLPIAGLVASTSTAIGVGSIELGNASDTTIARVSAGVISVEGVTVPTISSTNTLTNKRITKRTGTTTTSATPTINTDNVDFYSITAQSGNITSMTTNLSGTPTEGQTLWLALTATSGTPTVTWGTGFEDSTVTAPTALSTTRQDVGFVWNTVTSKWRCVAKA